MAEKTYSLPPPPKLKLDSQKATPAMVQSLDELRSSLFCPLCNQMLRQPSTLSCGHNFCLECIEHYTCNAWNCPVVGCGMPVTVRGGRDGSYLKINPQLETVVTSLDTICQTLNAAPNEWWKEPQPEVPAELEEQVNDTLRQDDDDNIMEMEDSEEFFDAEANNDKDEEVGGMIDFQMGTTGSDDEDNDNHIEGYDDKNENDAFVPPPNAVAAASYASTAASQEDDSQKTVKFRAPTIPSSSSYSVNTGGGISPSSSCTSLGSPTVDDAPTSRLSTVNESTSPTTNMSCILPSQSPGFSPIAGSQLQQQQSITTRTIVRPAVGLPQEEVTTIDELISSTKQTSNSNRKEEEEQTQQALFFTSALTNADKHIVMDLLAEEEETGLKLLLGDNANDLEEDNMIDVETDMSMVEFLSKLQNEETNTTKLVGICTNAEFETGDGYLVPRTFGYLVAVACGMQLRYINILQDMHKQSKNKNQRTSWWNSVCQEPKYQIIGDVDATTMNAPQRAMENHTLDCRGSSTTGTSLLKGYTILIHGDFDLIPPKRSRHGRGITGRKRSRTKNDVASSDNTNATNNTMYSKRRVKCLLQLCGARVYDLEEAIVDTDEEVDALFSKKEDDSSKVAILVRPHPKVRDWRAVQKTLTDSSNLFQNNTNGTANIVNGNWLLDSISNFEVMDFDPYKQPTLKKNISRKSKWKNDL